MTISVGGYVPILKWRLGEYQALHRLSEVAKDRITPLLMIPPIEYDFEEQRLKKTVQEHIETFVPRFVVKWGDRKALIDMHETLVDEVMDSGDHVLSHIFSELRKSECGAIPVLNFLKSSGYKTKVKEVISLDSGGICLRVRLPEIMNPNFNKYVSNLCAFLEIELDEIDLVLDLEEPENFEPYAVFSNVIVNGVRRIAGLSNFRSFVISGMSLKLSEIARPGDEVPRHEWNLYKVLINDLEDFRRPTYGDYTIETPKFVSMDMRMLKPAGKIVYTCDDTWLVPKGISFRGNESQMIDHCKTIVTSGKYSGVGFSFGDDRIDSTIRGADGCGNLPIWKQVGVSHHLEKVVTQLSNFHGP
jgi:hypothetical protein